MKKNLLYTEPCCWAVVFVSPTSSGVESNGAITTNAQLVRTANYCERNGLIIENVLVLTDNDRFPAFHKMVDFIRSRDYKVAVVADTADALFTHDFNKVTMLDYLYREGKIEIHLVKEKIILNRPYSRDDNQIWANIRNIHAEYHSGVMDIVKVLAQPKQQTSRSTKGKQHA